MVHSLLVKKHNTGPRFTKLTTVPLVHKAQQFLMHKKKSLTDEHYKSTVGYMSITNQRDQGEKAGQPLCRRGKRPMEEKDRELGKKKREN